jgi:hypothetical protein
MTGPEHHDQAEILFEEWWNNRNDIGRAQQFMPWLAAAQVHATLAVAAALEAAQPSSAETADPSGDSFSRNMRLNKLFKPGPE